MECFHLVCPMKCFGTLCYFGVFCFGIILQQMLLMLYLHLCYDMVFMLVTFIVVGKTETIEARKIILMMLQYYTILAISSYFVAKC